MGDLEKEFDAMGSGGNKANPFGQSSITKELLKQSRKEIETELRNNKDMDLFADDNNAILDDLADMEPQDEKPSKRDLVIDIEEGDYEQQNMAAHQILNDNVNKHEQIVAQNEAAAPIEDDAASGYSDMPDDQILAHFDSLYSQDDALRKILGDFPERYSVPEKQSILSAYKKGGGVQGLAEIIEDDPDEANEGEELEDDDGEELDIDLENPDDVKVIHDEFRKLYDSDENFRQSFGEEAL